MGKHFGKLLNIRNLLYIPVNIYLLLIVVVMPFYFKEGYNHIGTDKSYFFRTCTKYTAAVFLPLLAIYLICGLTARLKTKRAAKDTTKYATTTQRMDIQKLRWSSTDLFAIGYAVSVCLSYAFSDYRETALWGTTGWYMGMIPQLTFVGIYFVLSRMRREPEQAICLFFPVSAVVFVLGCLNRFDIWPIPMQNAGTPGFISTIGNINWYCGYMVSVLPLGIGLFWLDKGERMRKTVLLAIYCFVGFATAVTQGSDSGIFALAVVALFLFVSSAFAFGKNAAGQKWTRFWQLVLIFSAACAVNWVLRALFPERVNMTSAAMDLLTDTLFWILPAALGIAMLWTTRLLKDSRPKAGEIYRRICLMLAKALCVLLPVTAAVLTGAIVWNTGHPGALGALSDNSFFVFDADWGSGRGATWQMGAECFSGQDLLHKLTGVGPDCMADHIYQGPDAQLRQSAEQAFPGARLTNAHCELLTILVCGGLLGAMCFAGMMGSACVRFLRGAKEPAVSRDVAVACGLCVMAYLCNNLWSFQQTMSVATVFVMMGMGEKVKK